MVRDTHDGTMTPISRTKAIAKLLSKSEQARGAYESTEL